MTNVAQTDQVPADRDAAIAVLVEQDVAKWGETEREASRCMHADKSYGLLLNTLSSRAILADAPNAALSKAAKAALTKADKAQLRKGG